MKTGVTPNQTVEKFDDTCIRSDTTP